MNIDTYTNFWWNNLTMFLTIVCFYWSHPKFFIFRIWKLVKISSWRFSKRVASTDKYSKWESTVDDIISIVRRSNFGKPVDEEFFSDFKSLMGKKSLQGVVKSLISIHRGSHFGKPVDEEFHRDFKSMIRQVETKSYSSIMKPWRSICG